MAIYPGLLLPAASSDLPGRDGPPYLPLRSCFGWGLHGSFCCQKDGGLLRRLSTLTCDAGGIFLLHCPWSCLRRPLTGILPCEARTFLPHTLFWLCASGHVICLSDILKQEQKSCQESVPIQFSNAMHHTIW